MPVEIAETVAGLCVGTLGVYAWRNWPGSAAYAKYVKSAVTQSPLSFIEHYHFALLAAISENYLPINGFGYGVGVPLLVDEFFHQNPFGIGKPTQNASLALGAAEVLALLLSGSGG